MDALALLYRFLLELTLVSRRIYSEIIPCPHPGRLWVLQHGMQTALYWQIQARVILDLEEFPRSVGGNRNCEVFL